LKLELVYRGSRDGFTAAVFHEKADDRGDTVTVVKTTTGRVFGGYTNIPWSNSASQNMQKDSSSFVFQLGDNDEYFKYNSV